MTSKLRLCFFLLLVAIKNSQCTLAQKETKILDAILSPENYDPRVRPVGGNGTDGRTKVFVNTFVRSISSIDDVKMQYSVQLTFRLQWWDERLKFDDQSRMVKYVTVVKPKLLWMPDLFFSNEIEAHFHDFMVPNLYFRIFPDGEVLFSRRLSLTLSCPMNLKSYPMDEQVCSIRMASYAYTSHEIDFIWKESDPVQVVRSLHMPKFSLQKWTTDRCDSKTGTASYACVKVDFYFKRNLFYYLLRVYIPTTMLVLISFTSFWFESTLTMPRLMLSLLTLMTLALLTSYVSASMPVVSYTKAIDVWMGVCMTFVFAVFVEFVVVYYLNSASSYKKMHDQEDPGEGDALFTKQSEKGENKCTLRHHIKKLNFFETWSRRFKTKAKSIDVGSRVFFPVLFIIFNVTYWIAY